MSRLPLLAGNWKMNGSEAMAHSLISEITKGSAELTKIELVIFPPFVYIPLAKQLLNESAIAFGAQNVSHEKPGAFTGDIAADMLIEYGCEYVIVGHSERRHYHGETNELVAKKASRASEVGLSPIVCVGETLSDRENNKTMKVIQEQLAPVLELISSHQLKNFVIAYEPVWAIGTGKSASPEQAQATHQEIRQEIKTLNSKLANQIRILYGGSVKPENAKALFDMPDIDGALVGGASLQADQFLKIGKQCNNSF